VGASMGSKQGSMDNSTRAQHRAEAQRTKKIRACKQSGRMQHASELVPCRSVSQVVHAEARSEPCIGLGPRESSGGDVTLE
jgi:hypothetical protein